MKKRLRVSVRGLVEHCLRSGDLNLESWGPSSQFEMVDGIRAHQKIQASRGEGYRKEVSLSHTVDNEHFILEIGGRIDGVLETPTRVVIEEIKTTGGDIDALAEREDPTHWGQLQVYAYLYALDNELDAVEARLTYYQLQSAHMIELERRLTLNALRAFFDSLVDQYLSWAKRIDDWQQLRDATIETTAFPFDAYRPGQRAMAVQVYQAIRQQQRLLVRAPTGIGKTQATVFPAVKALGEGHVEKIFYLTARTTGRALAEKAVQELREGGLRLKSITLIAKDKICFNPEKACNADECEFARGFYDRVGDAVDDVFREDGFSRDAVEAIARRHRVCPFELSLALSSWVDLVICDYNYVFDPHTYLRRFFGEDVGAYVFLIDESHNLVDRARDMYSAELHKRDVVALRRLIDRGRHRKLHKSLGEINRALKALGERFDGAASELEAPQELLTPLHGFVKRAQEYLAAGIEHGLALRPTHDALVELYFEVSRFLGVAERFDERYVTCYESFGRELRIKLFCTDPSRELSESLDKARASIFFSATLTPMDYFRATLGCGEEAASYVLPSPFPEDNLRVLVNDRVATTYKRRDATRATLSGLLSAFVGERPGNYLLYFPSYEYLGAVAEGFDAQARVLVQRPEMDEAERAEFLERFSEVGDETLVGFAVMGGFFGEGIDLVGERLTGAAIVGVGLPGLSPERDQIRAHFDQTTGAGFDYAYMFPGMNRALQAAGRVIRSETDRGVILLIDERYSQARYRRLLPAEWRPVPVASESELRAQLHSFWSRVPGVVPV